MHKYLRIRRSSTAYIPWIQERKAGDALRLFCQEFGVPERLNFDGSKEKINPGTEFMQHIRTHNIDYHISESD